MKKLISASLALCIIATSLFTGVYAMAQDEVTSEDVKAKITESVNWLLSERTVDFTVSDSRDLYYYIKSGVDMSAYEEAYVESVKENLTENSGKIVTVVRTDYDENWTPTSVSDESVGVYANVIYNLNAFGYNPKDFKYNDSDSVNIVELFENLELVKDNENQYLYPNSFDIAKKYGLNDKLTEMQTFLRDNYYQFGTGSTYYTSTDSDSYIIIAYAPYKSAYDNVIDDAFSLIETYAKDGGYVYNLDNTYGEPTISADSTALALAAYSSVGNIDKATEIYNDISGFESETTTGAYAYSAGGDDNLLSTFDVIIGLEYYYDALSAYENSPEVVAQKAAEQAEAAAKQAQEDAETAKEAKEAADKALAEVSALYEKIAAMTATTTTTTTTAAATTDTAATVATDNSAIAKPKKTKIKKLKKGKKKITVQWKKVNGVKGYQVQVATNKKFTKNKKSVTVKKQKTTKKTIKKLKSNKKYYVRVRTYKVVNGKKVYSKWSKVKTVKTK